MTSENSSLYYSQTKEFIMKKLLLALPILTLVACDAQAQRSDAEIEQVVKNYLMENPEIILQSVEKYQTDQMAEMQKQTGENLKELLPEILATGPFIGKADSENIVVEFFDYNCGYCKRSMSTIKRLHSENEDIKIIFKELPILSPGSELLSRAALAVHKKHPEKYFDFHTKLMENKKPATTSLIIMTAKSVGIEDIDFEKAMQAPEITKQIEENREISAKIGIQGTPAFIINGELIGGAVPYETLQLKLK